MLAPDLLYIPTTTKGIIVCKNFLKKSKTLKKAPIFLELFGLNENTKWKPTDMMTNENGKITLLEELDISSIDWISFMKFIRLNDNENISIQKIVQLGIITEDEMKSIYYTSLKLGGVEEIDAFYINYHEIDATTEEDIKKRYNPQEPLEDYKNLFKWIIVSDNRQHTTLLNQNYSATSKSWRETNSINQYFYMRKEKTSEA